MDRMHERGQLTFPRLLILLATAVLLAIIVICAAFFFVRPIVRRAEIRQMLLPRLAIDQGGIVTSVAISPDGNTIFGGYSNDLVREKSGAIPAAVYVWDSSTGRLIRSLHGLYWRSSSVLASPDGVHIAAYGFTVRKPVGPPNGGVVEWNWKTGQQDWSEAGESPLSFSPSGKLLGMQSQICDTATAKCATTIHVVPPVPDDSHNGFTPDGKLFGAIGWVTLDAYGKAISGDSAVEDAGTRLHFWSVRTGKEVYSYPFIRCRDFAVAPDGKWLALLCDRGQVFGMTDGSVVRRIDLATGAVTWTRDRSMDGPNGNPDALVNSLVVSPNGKYVVEGSSFGQLVVLNAATGRELFHTNNRNLTGSTWAVPDGLAFSADGQTLVSRYGPDVLVWNSSILK